MCAVRGRVCAVRGGVCAVRGGVCAVRGGVCAVRSRVCAGMHITSYYVTLSPFPPPVVALYKLCFP